MTLGTDDQNLGSKPRNQKNYTVRIFLLCQTCLDRINYLKRFTIIEHFWETAVCGLNRSFLEIGDCHYNFGKLLCYLTFKWKDMGSFMFFNKRTILASLISPKEMTLNSIFTMTGGPPAFGLTFLS